METTTGGDHPTDFIPRDPTRPDDLQLDIFRDSPTLCQEDGDHDLGDSNRQPRTQFGVPRPPDQLVIHSPSLHPCSPPNGMTPDDLHLGDLQSPTMPPANHFDRPRQSTSPGGRNWARLQLHTLDRDASCTPDGVQNEAPKTNQIQSFHNSPPPI